jgi:plastocyanin
VKRLLIGAAVLIALVAFVSMKHPHQHLAINSAPQDPVVSTAPQVTVEIRNFDFFPRELAVKTGTAVTWVNRDAAPHDATDEAGDWSTSTLNQGDSATLTFDSPGVYRYLCTIHPNMRATLTVA